MIPLPVFDGKTAGCALEEGTSAAVGPCTATPADEAADVDGLAVSAAGVSAVTTAEGRVP